MRTATAGDQRQAILPSETHTFALGQAVHLRGGLRPTDNVYLVTATLPPVGDSPQYRIRSEAEKFERMATQAQLELADAPILDGRADLVERSFGPQKERHSDSAKS